MINIRRQVFETNSSSSHSISIAGGTSGLLDTIVPENGIVYLNGGSWGWEWEKYNDALTKANYAAAFAFDNQSMTDMLIDVIKEHTGAKEVFININSGGSPIDHQSTRFENGKALQAFDTHYKLKSWIFNPDSWLFTGNDNEMNPPNFYDVEFGIEYNYELSVDGIDITEKFESKPDNDSLITSLERILQSHPLNSMSRKSYPNNGYAVQYSTSKTLDGKEAYTFGNIKKNIVTLYKFDHIYTPKLKKYKGRKITDSVDIKFKIKRI